MEAKNYEIRNLIPTKRDIDFLSTIVYIAHYPTRSPIPDVVTARHLPHVSHWVDNWDRKGDMALIAHHEDMFLGAACYRLFSHSDRVAGFLSEQTPVLLLAVLPQYRRQGIGRRLLTSLMQRAKDASFSSLSLAVTIHNPAIKLYESVGFYSIQISEDSLATMWTSLAFSGPVLPHSIYGGSFNATIAGARFEIPPGTRRVDR